MGEVCLCGGLDGRGGVKGGYLPLDEVLYVGAVVIPHQHSDATNLLNIHDLTHPYRYFRCSRCPHDMLQFPPGAMCTFLQGISSLLEWPP